MSIYIHPDIRKQTLEQHEEFLQTKRARRLIMAQFHRQTVLAKATKLHDKALSRFQKQNETFEKDMERLVDLIERMQQRLYKMNDINSEMVNLEGVINDETG